jgi:hypothetical protein
MLAAQAKTVPRRFDTFTTCKWVVATTLEKVPSNQDALG